MPLKNQDVTFRKSRTGAPITAKNGEYVCNVAKMLFMMKPGYDDYDSDRGLDIQSKLFQTYVDGQRDPDYENEINEQFTRYTDLIPNSITAIYKNKALVIFFNVTYHNDVYILNIIGDKNGLEVILRDRAVPKIT